MDHGKSTFIGRLLYDAGYIKKYEFIALQQEGREIDFAHFLDIYREERENAMTMDTTKRFFETEKYQYTIIDSPGHKEFIKNMLSGVSEAQYAIVIVSCDEKERIQVFEGVVLAIRGRGENKSFTVRKSVGSVAVERIWPIFSPNIDKVEIKAHSKTRVKRAKLYNLRKTN